MNSNDNQKGEKDLNSSIGFCFDAEKYPQSICQLLELISKYKRIIKILEKSISEKDNQINSISEKTIALSSQLQELNSHASSLEEVLKTRDAQMATLSSQLQELNSHASSLEEVLKTRDAQMATLSSQLQELNSHASSLEEVLKTRDAQMATLSSQLQELNAHASSLEEVLKTRDAQMATLSSQFQELNAHASSLEEVLKTRDAQMATLSSQFQELNAHASSLEQEIAEMKRSVIWRMTMKFHNDFVERALPQETRRRRWYDLGLKGGRIFVNDGPKQAIREFRAKMQNQEIIRFEAKNRAIETSDVDLVYRQYINDLLNRADEKSAEYIPISKKSINLEDDDIKLIAFYLPQYHPIPENDEWWGKGFTDWTNVSKAVPQFIGHYQPHLPDELGFYDLRLIEIQKRQIELAKQYGIYGFCFHYYWFNGKRLLEKPLYQFLNNRELNIPFCICWANENWTRRWDGMEKEILISQTHSPENDIAFIEGLLPFFRDPRYIKINNRPVLIVYRAPLLPDAKATADLWRSYCKEQGIGDPYLITAQTFGFSDPRAFGFDAAVEFPPHTMPGCYQVNDKTDVINPKFEGKIWDYNRFVKSRHYLEKVPFKLFKTVMPGWDNTARMPNKASIFHDSNPANYKEWLWNVVEWTAEVHQPQERIVFINAMNEWAEGAHLEPDRKYGYGYLQSTAEVVQRYRKKFVQD